MENISQSHVQTTMETSNYSRLLFSNEQIFYSLLFPTSQTKLNMRQCFCSCILLINILLQELIIRILSRLILISTNITAE